MKHLNDHLGFISAFYVIVEYQSFSGEVIGQENIPLTVRCSLNFYQVSHLP